MIPPTYILEMWTNPNKDNGALFTCGQVGGMEGQRGTRKSADKENAVHLNGDG